MAKSANSKVVFVPMQLQSDVTGQLASGSGGNSSSGMNAIVQNESATDTGLLGSAGQVGLLNSISSV